MFIRPNWLISRHRDVPYVGYNIPFPLSSFEFRSLFLSLSLSLSLSFWEGGRKPAAELNNAEHTIAAEYDVGTRENMFRLIFRLANSRVQSNNIQFIIILLEPESELPTQWIFFLNDLVSIESESYVTTDGQSGSPSWNKAPIWGLRQDFYYSLTVTVFLCGAFSLKRGRVCRLHLLLVLASTVILGSEALGTRDHILLSQIRNFPFRRLLRLAGLRWRYSIGLDSQLSLFLPSLRRRLRNHLFLGFLSLVSNVTVWLWPRCLGNVFTILRRQRFLLYSLL
jgi:hypothetical protein